MRLIFDLLRDPLLCDLDVDGQSRLQLHGMMLERKQMLRRVFAEFHQSFRSLDQRLIIAKGIEVELGAGVAPMRDSYSAVLATDIVNDPNLDLVIDAQAMGLASGSVRVVFGQNCFHHFSHPDQFFQELERVLAPGGGAILLEPYYGQLAAFLFRRMFRSEAFDRTQLSWNTPTTGPMNGANQALSYIVFERDRAKFERKYPSLKIVHQECAGNYLKYLLSGGVNFRQLLPDQFIWIVEFWENLLRPLRPWLALHHIVVIRKDIV